MLHRMGVATGYDLERAIAAAGLGERLGEAALPAMLGRAGAFPPQPDTCGTHPLSD